MEVRTQGNDGPTVPTADACVDAISAQLHKAQQQWVHTLAQKPQQFAQIEKDIHATLQRLADQLAASVLAQATTQSTTLEREKKR